MPGPEEQPAWQALTALASELGRIDVSELLNDESRNAALRLDAAGILVDLSRQRMDRRVLAGLEELAREQALPAWIEGLFRGEHVNNTEDRPALHTALRAAPEDRPEAAGREVDRVLGQVRRLAAEVIDGRRRGFGGKAFTDVVHIGIGGSHLGPELAVSALAPAGGGLRCHFAANVDGAALDRALRGLEPATTLFVVASKSFSTLETRLNAESARSWFLERTASRGAIAGHFVAVTANTDAAAAFGIDPASVFPMWDWVGGRYSLWSAVGLPLALSAGPDAFDELLAGARALDHHFRTAPLAANAPVLMALAAVWNYNFLGAASLAVLPYDERLALLPDYLQQLEMESNGKSVHRDGSAVGVHTQPVVWGGAETPGQHSFHQLLHQGTRSFTADFVLTATPGHRRPGHHGWLLANGLAQAQAMMVGDPVDDPHRRVTGNKATTTLLLESLSPFTLGALLALYEHKVFCQGVIWNINSFDQWGVELGKRLAVPIHEQLGGSPTTYQDAATRFLVEQLRRRGE